MSVDAVEVSNLAAYLTEQQLSQYLLQVILDYRGICHESTLICALKKLQQRCVNSGESADWSIEHWQKRLNEVINKLNVRLNLLDFKIVKVNHGIGKKSVSRVYSDGTNSETTDSNRFYVYVNKKSTEELKLATRFNPREIEFIKWALEQIVLAGTKVIYESPDDRFGIRSDVDLIRSTIMGEDLPSWRRYATFRVGSRKLSNYKQLNALEIEGLIEQLCRLKWFYKTGDGEVGIDLKAVVELEDYIIDTYQLIPCPVCGALTLQGIMIENDQKGCTYWHVDCYQHYVTYIGKEYSGTSLITNGVYVI